MPTLPPIPPGKRPVVVRTPYGWDCHLVDEQPSAVAAAPVAAPAAPRSRRLVAVAALFLVGLVGGGAWAVHAAGNRPKTVAVAPATSAVASPSASPTLSLDPNPLSGADAPSLPATPAVTPEPTAAATEAPTPAHTPDAVSGGGDSAGGGTPVVAPPAPVPASPPAQPLRLGGSLVVQGSSASTSCTNATGGRGFCQWLITLAQGNAVGLDLTWQPGATVAVNVSNANGGQHVWSTRSATGHITAPLTGLPARSVVTVSLVGSGQADFALVLTLP